MAELKILVIHCADTHPNYRLSRGDLEQWHMGPCDIYENGKLIRVNYLGKSYIDRTRLPNDVIDQRSIREIHGRGWDRLGYSDLIHRDGDIENLTPYNDDDWVDNSEKTWGVAGINSIARHVCLEGGRNSQNESKEFLFQEVFTDAQFTALTSYINDFIKRDPRDKIAGHYHFNAKTCPNFMMGEFFLKAGINLKHMYNAKHN